MPKATLFKATKNSVTLEREVVRDGLTPEQAKAMARRLTSLVTDDFKATIREQVFEIEFTGSFRFTNEPDENNEVWTEASVKRDVMDALRNMDWMGMDFVSKAAEKYSVTVKKVSDGQVPNV